MDKDFLIAWISAAPYRIRNRIVRWAGNADLLAVRDFILSGLIIVASIAFAFSPAGNVCATTAQPIAQEAPAAMRVVSADEWSHPTFELISELPTPEEAAAVTIDEPQDMPRVSRYCQRHPHRRACR